MGYDDMKDRYWNAVAIDDGACNPIAITNALKQGIDDIRKETPGTDSILQDPAIRLMVHQLAHLTGVLNFKDYDSCREICELRQKVNVDPDLLKTVTDIIP